VSVNRVTKVTKVVAGFSAIVGDENGVVTWIENLKMFLKQSRRQEDAKKI
jgi:hypothetical protein